MARFLVFLVFLMMVSPSLAGDEWLFADTKREVLYLTLHTIDWAQTRTIARHPEMYRETNVFLGEHPSTGRVDRYFVLSKFLIKIKKYTRKLIKIKNNYGLMNDQ